MLSVVLKHGSEYISALCRIFLLTLSHLSINNCANYNINDIVIVLTIRMNMVDPFWISVRTFADVIGPVVGYILVPFAVRLKFWSADNSWFLHNHKKRYFETSFPIHHVDSLHSDKKGQIGGNCQLLSNRPLPERKKSQYCWNGSKRMELTRVTF